jgi:hypothetical protein
VLAARARDAGQVGGHRQPQLASDGRQVVGGDGCQVGEGHHAQTWRPGSGSYDVPPSRSEAATRQAHSYHGVVHTVLPQRFRALVFAAIMLRGFG